MRIIKHINPNYPNKPIYRCKIDNVTASRFDYDEIVAWKDEKLSNSIYYQEKYEDSEHEVKYFKDKYYAVWSLMEKIQEYENN